MIIYGICIFYVLPMVLLLVYWFVRARFVRDEGQIASIAFGMAFFPALNWMGLFFVTMWSLFDLGMYLTQKVKRHE